jgi:hypothetical protein
MGGVFVVHATQKLRARLPRQALDPDARSSTALGAWYATAVFWKPQVALFVNEQTLLPVFLPLAPAAALITRFPLQLSDLLAGHGVPAPFIAHELEQMDECRLAKTANRSVVGIMNEFTLLAEAWRDTPAPDLQELSLRLAETPCGPLYQRHISPDRELAALVAQSG